MTCHTLKNKAEAGAPVQGLLMLKSNDLHVLVSVHTVWSYSKR